MVTLPVHQTPVKHGGRWDVAVKAQLGVISCPKYWLLVVLDEILGHWTPRAICFSTGFSPKVSAKRPGGHLQARLTQVRRPCLPWPHWSTLLPPAETNLCL